MKKGDEPYYPVNNEKNNALYAAYKALADKESNVLFGGRLGMYKYYDMDDTVSAAFGLLEKEGLPPARISGGKSEYI